MERLGFVTGQRGEDFGGDQNSRLSPLLDFQGVMETPRRAGASITERADRDGDAISQFDHVWVGAGGVHLSPVDEVRHAQFT